MLIVPPTSQGSSFLIQRAIQTDISGALGNYGQSQTPSFPSQHSLLDRYLLTSSLFHQEALKFLFAFCHEGGVICTQSSWSLTPDSGHKPGILSCI